MATIGLKWVKTVASIKDLLSSLNCLLCSLTLNKPAAVGRCAHMFCHDCIMNHCQVSADLLCPKCKEPFWRKDIHVDHSIEQIISLCQTWLPKFAADLDQSIDLIEEFNETEVPQLQSIEQLETFDSKDIVSMSNYKKAITRKSADKSAEEGDDFQKREDSTTDAIENRGTKARITEADRATKAITEEDAAHPITEEDTAHDESVPLYHTPPENDRDSYVTASNKSPVPSIASMPDQSSCHTIDLVQSSDAANTDQEKLHSIFEISDDDLAEVNEAPTSPIKVSSNKRKLSASKGKSHPDILKPSLPNTPQEVTSQKSQHVRPVEKTYIRRGKRKCAQPANVHHDDVEVTNWLQNSMIFNIPEGSPKSKKQCPSLPEKTPKSAKNTTKSIIRTRSRSSTSSIKSVEVLKTPVQKRDRSSSLNKATPPSSSTNIAAPLSKQRSTPDCNKTPQSKVQSQRKLPKTPSSTPRNKRNQKGETSLHSAAITGNLEKLRLLLEEGEDPDVSDNAGWTPLHEACIHRKYDCAKLLLEFGAPVNSKAHNHDVPLHDACAKNSLDIIKLLLEHGACKTVKNVNGLTPVDFAGSDEVIELLEGATDTKNMSIVNDNGDVEEDMKDPVVGFSGLTAADIAPYQNIKNMSFKTAEDMSDQVTHLVCGVDENKASKRTIKFLKAMTMGCAIVQKSWLEQSAATSEWADVSDHFVNGAVGFEATAPATSFSHHRTGVPGLFTGLTFYLDKKMDFKPNRETICELIQSVNGKLLSREPRNSVISRTKVYHAPAGSVLHSCPTIIISDASKTNNFIVKSHFWILDCIASYKIID